jgi:AbrB family looped-hinge helix DNA binding protein
MRLTGKGQVTIPVRVRKRLGSRPGDDMVITVEGDSARITLSPRSARTGRRIVDGLRNRGDVALNTDQIVALTRGE